MRWCVAEALAFALRFDGRKRKHNAGEFMAAIVAWRRVALIVAKRTGLAVSRDMVTRTLARRNSWRADLIGDRPDQEIPHGGYPGLDPAHLAAIAKLFD